MSQEDAALFEVAWERWNHQVTIHGKEDNDIMHHNLTASALQQLRTAIESKRQSSWTTRAAKRMTTSLVHAATGFSDKQPQIAFDVLDLLLKAMTDQWNESLAYASFVTKTTNTDEFLALYKLMTTTTDKNLKRYVVMIVATWWRAAEGIGRYTSINDCGRPDSYLFDQSSLQREHLEQLALVAIDFLTGRTEDGKSVLESQALCASFLAGLLKQNVTGWLLRHSSFPDSNKTISEMCSHLFNHVQRLNNDSTNDESNLPPTCSRLGLAALSLLSLIQLRDPHHSLPELDSLLRSSQLVEHIARVALPTNTWSSPRAGPNWTFETGDAVYGEKEALDILYTWSCDVSGGEGWSIFNDRMEQHCRQFCHETWNSISENASDNNSRRLEHALPGLLFLHTSASCRHFSHGALMEVLLATPTPPPAAASSSPQYENGAEASCQQLLKSLCLLCHDGNFAISVAAASVLRALLSCKRNTATHDEVSRTIWKSIDDDQRSNDLFGSMMQALQTRSDCNEKPCQTQVLCKLLTIDALVSSQHCCQRIFLNSELAKIHGWVDLLVEIMTVSDDTTSDGRLQEAIAFSMPDEDTPKIGNLDQKDDSSERTIPISTRSTPLSSEGALSLIPACQLVAATILSRMAVIACESITPEREYLVDQLCLVQGNIRNAVQEFVLSIPVMSWTSQGPSKGMVQNQMRLFTTMAASCGRNEDLVASVMFNMELARAKTAVQKDKELAACQRELEEMTEKAKQLELERDGLKNEIASKDITNEREVHRAQLRASADASRMIEVHATERSRAETRAVHLSERTAQAEAKLKEVESTAKADRACADLSKSELREATANIKELEQVVQAQRGMIEEHESRNSEISRELEKCHEELNNTKSQKQLIEKKLSSTEDSFHRARNNAKELQNDLETSYCNLVSLAHLYQTKEKDMLDTREENNRRVNEVKKKLEAERQRYEDMEENERCTERENVKLRRKLARTKEKLDEERRDRREEQERKKRHGPVSYINNLHDDSMMSINKSQRNQSVRDKSTFSGKENDFARSQSNRRKHYQY